jgi:hypothetical protein
MKKTTILAAALLVCAAAAHAESITEGTYLASGTGMNMTLKIMAMPGGKMIIDGRGTSSDGKFCRIGDLAQLAGSTMTLGACRMQVVPTSGGFVLDDPNRCATCDQGASITGTYIRQQ